MVNRPALYASPGPAHSPAFMKRLLPFLLAAGPPALVLLLALAMVVVGAPAGMTATTMATMADMADCTDDTDTTAAAATGATVTPNDVAVSLARAFAKAGYSRASTAGVLGVIQFESGMNPAQEQIGEPDPMLRGYGLNQWTPRSKIRDWMDANHVSGEDSDADVQIRMLVATAQTDFNNHFLAAVRAEGHEPTDNDLRTWWLKADNPEDAAVAWMAGYGRPYWADRHEKEREQYARSYYDSKELADIDFPSESNPDGKKDAAFPSDTSDTDASCDADADDSSDGDAKYGDVGGAPTNTHDFGWMCATKLKICHAGDMGAPPLDWQAVGDYQCYWYWLARSWLVHDGDVINPHTANGGQLSDWAAGTKGWTRSDEPRPGAGVCFWGGGNNHVAFVEKVDKDPSGWKIMISEGNFNDGGAGLWTSYNARWLTKGEYAAASGNGFFWKDSWKL